MTPRVSVITPMRDGGAFVEAAIASVRAQALTDWEHLVVDDASTDDGPARVRAAAAHDPRLRLLALPDGQGAAAARNAAIAAASGRYVAFLDCDDLWYPDKLSRQVAAMEAAGAAFSWTGYDVIDAAGARLRMQRVPTWGDVSDLLDRRLVIGCLTAVYDRARLGRMTMDPRAGIEDFCLWLDILRRCAGEGLPVQGLDAPLAAYRVHGRGRSARKTRAARAYWRACRDHAGLPRGRATWYFLNYALRSLAERRPRPRRD